MKTLIVAIDFSISTAAVCEQAALLALAFKAKLWILHVASHEMAMLSYDASPFAGYTPDLYGIPANVQLARDIAAEEFKREHRQLLACSESMRNRGIDSQALLLKGHAGKQILEKAKELEADLIVVGSHGHGHGLLHKALVGSVSESILRYARCNVLVVPSPPEKK